MSASAASMRNTPAESVTVKIKRIDWGKVRRVTMIGIYMLIFVSMYQAGAFMYDTSEPGIDRIFRVTAIVTFIVLGHAAVYMLSLAFSAKRYLLGFLCICMIIPVAYVSIYTSAAKYNSSTFTAIQNENESSTAYQAAIGIAQQRQQNAAVMQERAANAPATYMSKSEDAINMSRESLDKAQEALSTASNLNVSPTQKTYAALEGSLGLSSVAINNGMAILQEILPMAIALYWGSIIGRRFIKVESDDGPASSKK